MEKTTEVNNKKTNETVKDILFDIEELDEVNFRPVTSGLGFHHEEVQKKRTIHTLKKRSSPLTKPNTPIKARSTARSSVLNPASTTVSKDSLSSIYGNMSRAKITVTAKETPKENIETQIVEASSVKKIMAWGLDFLLINFLVSATFSLFALSSGFPLKTILGMFSLKELGIFYGIIYSLYYLAYFSILDSNQTLGKAMMKIKMVSTDDKRSDIQSSFFRAFITLLGHGLLFFPMVLDFQGKLSDTKVIED